MVTLYTIGFTKKNAEQFFELLKKNHISRLVDVRINNSSQLAGFAKGVDLKYFVKHICNAEYVHIIDFAPTKDLLSKWRKEEVNWEQYTKVYLGLLKERGIIKKYGVKCFDNSCFLCSEETPEMCHRRLLVEYMKENSTEDVNIVHLV
ncbi:DUF488 domain-containing protein [uncultured Bacteroides sp.]|uniref:DUF488 domain-containing protein n=1 Tax=uncultured Bacteroides sp. TaxID=162156 RepID=UPI00261DA7E2|nr:DUF488 domain-containing protein [uncultured Bacteroides sp.]